MTIGGVSSIFKFADSPYNNRRRSVIFVKPMPKLSSSWFFTRRLPLFITVRAKMNEGFTDGTLMEFTEPEQIAEVVYQAATDEKDQLTYLAGNDAVRLYTKRLSEGPEAYRIGLTKYLNLPSPYPQA